MRSNWIGMYGAVVLMLLASVSTRAQQTGSRVGIKAGLNWTQLRAAGENMDHESGRVGFQTGVFGRLGDDKLIGIQGELLYTQKGSRVTYDGLIDQEFTYKLNYLELPVFVAVRFVKIFEAHVGAYAGYLLNSRVRSVGDLGTDDDELDRDNFQGADFGFVVGGGVNFGRGQLGLRFNHGLAKVASSNDTELLLGNGRNSAAQVYLSIGLSKK